jgi:hypothetical protein
MLVPLNSLLISDVEEDFIANLKHVNTDQTLFWKKVLIGKQGWLPVPCLWVLLGNIVFKKIIASKECRALSKEVFFFYRRPDLSNLNHRRFTGRCSSNHRQNRRRAMRCSRRRLRAAFGTRAINRRVSIWVPVFEIFWTCCPLVC